MCTCMCKSTYVSVGMWCDDERFSQAVLKPGLSNAKFRSATRSYFRPSACSSKVWFTCAAVGFMVKWPSLENSVHPCAAPNIVHG